MNRRGLVFEFNSKEKPQTVDRLDLLDFFETAAQICFNPFHVREHAIVFNRFERSCDRCHRNHAAAECCPQIVLFDL